MGVGIILGILVWGIVGSCTRFFVLQTPETGMFEGMVAGRLGCLAVLPSRAHRAV